MVLKAVKMRIYPNSAQRDQLWQTFGCVRFVWNQMLNMQIERRKNNPEAKFVNAFGMNNLLKQLKVEYPWLKQAESTALQSANRNLADAFQRFFKGPNKFPRFKSRKYSQSYNSKYVNGNIRILDRHHIKLPKLGVVYFRAGRLPLGKIKNVTVRLNVASQYYITVLVESENQTLPKTGKYIGGDLGLKSLLNLSDGYKEPLNHFESKYSKKLHHWEKLRSRRYLIAQQAIAWDHHNKVLKPCQLDDFKNYQKARIMVAKYRQKIANQRLDQLQKFTTILVKKYDIIVLERLNTKGMMKNHHLARAIANASWSKLVDILQYKCEWYGKKLIQINPSYTSQICANCGESNHRLGLSKAEWLGIREWDCPNCGKHLDRDINAAQVILQKGLAIQ